MIIVFCLFLSCESSHEEFQINEKFVNIYVEFRIATIGNNQNKDRAAKSRRLILESYQVKPEDFKAYMRNIMNKPETWDKFQAKVIERLSEIEKAHKGE